MFISHNHLLVVESLAVPEQHFWRKLMAEKSNISLAQKDVRPLGSDAILTCEPESESQSGSDVEFLKTSRFIPCEIEGINSGHGELSPELRLSSYRQPIMVDDPYEGMPVLETMTMNPLASPLRKDENVFTSLARYCFPGLEISKLTSVPLQNIYNKTKILTTEWSESPSCAVVLQDLHFLDSFFNRGVDGAEMADWERLRILFLARHEWFMSRKRARRTGPRNVIVKVLPSSVELLKSLPRVRSFSEAEGLMKNYICIVNLGEPVGRYQTRPVDTSPGPKRMGRRKRADITRSSNSQVGIVTPKKSLIRRSIRLQKRSDSMVEALKSHLDSSENIIELNDYETDGWPFGAENQSQAALDETQHTTQISIFQPGAPESQLSDLSKEHFMYPADQLTSDSTGLTLTEELAFEGLSGQLLKYYMGRYFREGGQSVKEFMGMQGTPPSVSPAPTLEPISPDKNSSISPFPSPEKPILTLAITPEKNFTHQEATSRMFSLPEASTSLELLVENSSLTQLRLLRKDSTVSSIESEQLDVEVISEQKAVLTALKVPDEHASVPTEEFLRKFAGKYIREVDIPICFDPDDIQSDDTRFDDTTRQKESFNNDKVKDKKCILDHCRLGCVCESLQLDQVIRNHCGKLRCLFGCVCITSKIILLDNDIENMDIRSRLRPRVSLMNWKRFNSGSITGHEVRKRPERETKTTRQETKAKKRSRSSSIKLDLSLREDCEIYTADIGEGLEIEEVEEAIPMSHAVDDIAQTPSPDNEQFLEPAEQGHSSVDEELACLNHRTEPNHYKRHRFSPYNCKPCHIRTPLASLDLPFQQLETPCAPPQSDDVEGRRGVHTPTPLEVVDDHVSKLSMITSKHGVHALIQWSEECIVPKANQFYGLSDVTDTVITLPIPPTGETWFLFGIPDSREGDVHLHLHDIQILVPLERLKEIKMDGNDAGKTVRIRLVNSNYGPILASNGVQCDCYYMPYLPNLLVFGPHPIVSKNEPVLIPTELDSVNNVSMEHVSEFAFRTEPYRMNASPEALANSNISGCENWNGNGDLIPSEFLESSYEDFMFEFPPRVDSGPKRSQRTECVV